METRRALENHRDFILNSLSYLSFKFKLSVRNNVSQRISEGTISIIGESESD